MREEDYVALGEHLKTIEPVFFDFGTQHGFARVDQGSLGRYPRRRIEKSGDVTRWIELWLQFDSNGKHYEKFRPGLPYDLSVGAHIDVVDKIGSIIRYYATAGVFSGIPFEQFAAALPSELEKCVQLLERYDPAFLQQHGARTVLRPRL
jgi:hypothetical protein